MVTEMALSPRALGGQPSMHFLYCGLYIANKSKKLRRNIRNHPNKLGYESCMSHDISMANKEAAILDGTEHPYEKKKMRCINRFADADLSDNIKFCEIHI
jgi:hypothetical protein